MLVNSPGRRNTAILKKRKGVLKMKYRTRTYYTEKQKTFMWERWKQGDTLHEIAALFNRTHSTIQGIFSRAGGIRPFYVRSNNSQLNYWIT